MADRRKDIEAAEELMREAACQHEDTVLVCPFCGETTVDSDTHVCSICHEGVHPHHACVYCGEYVTQEDAA